MRKTILFFAALLALFTGCQREENPSPEMPVFREVSVSIGEDGTRSLVSIEAENFKKASLFAFYHSTGKIAVYPESAGDMVGTGPVAIETTTKTFDWALPVDQALDIYVIVNYGEELGATLAGYRSNANLTESTLDALKFTALDNVYMSDIEAAGIPMSGVVHTTLANESSPLNVTVKRLFAKYVLSFDISDLTANNASLQALHIVTENVNTEVPFFQDGFKQTVRSKFKEYDRASDLDLEQIQSGQPIVLYVPENCQGDIMDPEAEQWYNVRTLGSKVANCTYVDMAVKIVDTEGCWKNYNIALYLGSDCRTSFDVIRNVSTAIKIMIPYAVPIIVGEDYFYFDNHDLVTVNGGEDVQLNFTTSLDYTEIGFDYMDAASEEYISDAFTNQVKESNYVKLTANPAYAGHRFIVTGGSAAKNAQDQKPVEITNQTIILLTLNNTLPLYYGLKEFPSYSSYSTVGPGKVDELATASYRSDAVNFNLNSGGTLPKVSFVLPTSVALLSSDNCLSFGDGGVNEMRIFNNGQRVIIQGVSGVSEYNGCGMIPVVCTTNGTSRVIGYIEMYLIGGLGLYIQEEQYGGNGAWECGATTTPKTNTLFGGEMFSTAMVETDWDYVDRGLYTGGGFYSLGSSNGYFRFCQAEDVDDLGIARWAKNGEERYLNHWAVPLSPVELDQICLYMNFGSIFMDNYHEHDLVAAADESCGFLKVKLDNSKYVLGSDDNLYHVSNQMGLYDNNNRSYLCFKDFLARHSLWEYLEWR